MKGKKEILHLFEGYGIELEYMIVRKDTLSVLPISDQLIEKAAGEISGEILYEGVGWSNELVLHVLEMKTPGPAKDLKTLPEFFGDSIQHANRFLEHFGGMLMPTAMHPFFKPHEETRLWPHDNKEIYETYDRIFNCQGHGWSNLQSVHINLPFKGDSEFGKLHAAIRLILPLLPALAASSPIVEGNLTGLTDNRLEFYRKNQASLPVIAGKIIPEQVFSKKEYQKQIYDPIKKASAPFDKKNILDPVWLNSRGAIARFDRNAVEIRLLDIQECPKADLAISALIISLIRSLTEGFWLDLDSQKQFTSESLLEIFLKALAKSEKGIILDQNYLKLFHYPKCDQADFLQLLSHIFEILLKHDPDLQFWEPVLRVILAEGSLSTRITRAVDQDKSKKNIEQIYRKLCNCLAENELFHG